MRTQIPLHIDVNQDKTRMRATRRTPHLLVLLIMALQTCRHKHDKNWWLPKNTIQMDCLEAVDKSQTDRVLHCQYVLVLTNLHNWYMTCIYVSQYLTRYILTEVMMASSTGDSSHWHLTAGDNTDSSISSMASATYTGDRYLQLHDWLLQ